jgi:hypothetical protein
VTKAAQEGQNVVADPPLRCFVSGCFPGP